MTKQKAIEIIRDIVESYIDISNGNLTTTEKWEVIELIDQVETLINEG